MRCWMDFGMDVGINFESISDLFSRAFRRKRNKNSKKRKVREASAASEASAKSTKHSEIHRNKKKNKVECIKKCRYLLKERRFPFHVESGLC